LFVFDRYRSRRVSMPLTASDVVRVSLHGFWTNQRPIITVWHVRATGAPNRIDVARGAAQGVLDLWIQHAVPVLVNNYGINSASYVDLDSEQGSTGTVTHAPDAFGGQTATSAGPNVGVMIRKLYSGTFRGTKPGRLFIPGGSEAQIDEDGAISSTALQTAATAIAAFHSAVVGFSSAEVSTMTPVVVHTPSEEVTVTKTIRRPLKSGFMTQNDITSYQAETVSTGIQRRAGAPVGLLRGAPRVEVGT
jgi:hypothetical protein